MSDRGIDFDAIRASIHRTTVELCRAYELENVELGSRVAPWIALSQFGNEATWWLARAQAQWGKHRKRGPRQSLTPIP